MSTAAAKVSGWVAGFLDRVDAAVTTPSAKLHRLHSVSIDAEMERLAELQERAAALDRQRDVIHDEAKQVQDAITAAFEDNTAAKTKLRDEIEVVVERINGRLAQHGLALMTAEGDEP